MPDLRFDDRVAVITGAGGGLGRSYALMLAARGARVVVNDIGIARDTDDLDDGPAHAVVDEIRAAGGQAVADTNNVATPEGGDALVQQCLEQFGRVDVVINNAGILRDRAFHNLSAEQVDSVLKVHLYGAFNVTKPAWLAMRRQRYGRVLNTTSVSGWIGNFGQANYGAAKTGVIVLTKVLAIEGAKYGIQVNAISPAATTRMSVDSTRPINALLNPDLVAPVACWLVHEACPATGEIFTAMGGRVARLFFGTTKGYFDPHLTAEGVRDNFDIINDETGYRVPRVMGDELVELQERAAGSRT